MKKLGILSLIAISLSSCVRLDVESTVALFGITWGIIIASGILFAIIRWLIYRFKK
ncbi:MAG: hypothetical protein ACI30B_04455 [Paludibacteraceae bacterium]